MSDLVAGVARDARAGAQLALESGSATTSSLAGGDPAWAARQLTALADAADGVTKLHTGPVRELGRRVSVTADALATAAAPGTTRATVTAELDTLLATRDGFMPRKTLSRIATLTSLPEHLRPATMPEGGGHDGVSLAARVAAGEDPHFDSAIKNAIGDVRVDVIRDRIIAAADGASGHGAAELGTLLAIDERRWSHDSLRYLAALTTLSDPLRPHAAADISAVADRLEHAARIEVRPRWTAEAHADAAALRFSDAGIAALRSHIAAGGTLDGVVLAQIANAAAPIRARLGLTDADLLAQCARTLRATPDRSPTSVPETLAVIQTLAARMPTGESSQAREMAADLDQLVTAAEHRITFGLELPEYTELGSIASTIDMLTLSRETANGASRSVAGIPADVVVW